MPTLDAKAEKDRRGRNELDARDGWMDGWMTVGCCIICIHSIPETCARRTPPSALSLSLKSQETAFAFGAEEEVTIFAAGSLARVHLGYGRHTE